MEWKVLEILEERIEKVLVQLQTLTRENEVLRNKLQEQENLVEQARTLADGLEEEKSLIRNKVDGLIQKINQMIE